MPATDNTLYAVLTTLLIGLAGAIAVVLLARALGRHRPGGRFGVIAGVALGTRTLTTLLVAALGSYGAKIRGLDDPLFLGEARHLGGLALTNGQWLTSVKGNFLTTLTGLQVRTLTDPAPLGMRLSMAAIGAAAVLFLAAAAYDVAGRSAAWVAGGLVAIEPSNVFFSTILQKDALVVLAEGVVCLGAVRAWVHGSAWQGVALMAGGCLLAAAARPYAGFMLGVGAAIVAVMVLVRAWRGQRRRLAWLAASLVVLMAAAIAFGHGAASQHIHSLQTFYQSQTSRVGKLALPSVDLTTPTGFVTGLVQRTYEYIVLPYPWQVADLQQRLGVLPTLLAWCLVVAVLVALVRRRRQLATVAPVLVLTVVVIVSYALTTANAGTGFRHRTHLLFMLGGLFGMLAGPHVAEILSPHLSALAADRPLLRRRRVASALTANSAGYSDRPPGGGVRPTGT